jgi:serine/threonine protein kinase
MSIFPESYRVALFMVCAFLDKLFLKLLINDTVISTAPEVIDDLGYSQQCDIWSIGVIMFTL